MARPKSKQININLRNIIAVLNKQEKVFNDI